MFLNSISNECFSNLVSQNTPNDYKGTLYQNEPNITSPARRSEVSPIQNHVSTLLLLLLLLFYGAHSSCPNDQIDSNIWSIWCWSLFNGSRFTTPITDIKTSNHKNHLLIYYSKYPLRNLLIQPMMILWIPWDNKNYIIESTFLNFITKFGRMSIIEWVNSTKPNHILQ